VAWRSNQERGDLKDVWDLRKWELKLEKRASSTDQAYMKTEKQTKKKTNHTKNNTKTRSYHLLKRGENIKIL